MAALLLGSSGLMAQSTAYTDPSGFVTIDITPAPGAGQSSTTAFSVTLRNSKLYTGSATAVSGQTITVTGAGWTPSTQWADAAKPHLVYVATATGEEAFLITENTADTLTVSASYDLDTRFSNGATIFIVEAPTLGSLFGTDPADVQFLQGSVSDADNLYLWAGSSWVTYYFNGSSWKSTSNPFGIANNDVVFPDDGIFVIRRSTGVLALVLTGSVPTESQLSNIASGSTFVGSRYPVDTTISQMAFNNLPGWATGSISDADGVHFWTGTAWKIYYHTGVSWKASDNPFGNADDDVIPGNSALFIIKASAGDGSAEAEKPYSE